MVTIEHDQTATVTLEQRAEPAPALPREAGTPGPHIADADLQLYIRGQLKSLRVSALEDHALGCARCQVRITETARLVGQSSALSDRQRAYAAEENRLGHRFRVSGIGSLHVLTPLERDRVVVRMLDVSVNGIGLLLPRPLEAGALVQVHFGKVFSLGEVRYCRTSEGEFHAGILVQDVTVL
jgi:hypothetical protein